MKQLLLGGARSGKSQLAAQLADPMQRSEGRRVTYLATATTGDREKVGRIGRHRAERPAGWSLIEKPLGLAPCDLNLVCNEAGPGIVPADPLSRRFRDHAGWMHQSLAEVRDHDY